MTNSEEAPQQEASVSPTPSDFVLRVAVDDEEEETFVRGEDDEPRPFPFRRIGVAFLVIAIIVAIILAAVPANLNGNGLGHTAKYNTTLGNLFKGLIGSFLLSLFLCLFFTYYLGGSRDTWENPVFSGIRLNFSNITAIIGLFLEFLQIFSFSLNYRAVFVGSENLRNLQYLAIPFSPGEAFRVMYWIMFVIAFSPYIFIVTVRMIIYTINRRKGEADAAAFVQAYQQKIYSILWVLVNTIYIPIISTMLSGIDCTFRDATYPDGEYINTIDSDNDLICLSRNHLKYIVCTLIALVIYYPAASFAQAQTQNISDIKFKPKIVFVFVQGKVLLVAADVFYTDYAIPYLAFVLIVNFVFLGVNLRKSPCLVVWINQLRTIFFVMCVWMAVCSLIAAGMANNAAPGASPPVAPLVVLVLGLIAAGVGLPIFFYIWRRVRSNVAGSPIMSSSAATTSSSSS